MHCHIDCVRCWQGRNGGQVSWERAHQPPQVIGLCIVFIVFLVCSSLYLSLSFSLAVSDSVCFCLSASSPSVSLPYSLAPPP